MTPAQKCLEQRDQYNKTHRGKFAVKSKSFDSSLKKKKILYVQMHLSVDPDHRLCEVDFE